MSKESSEVYKNMFVGIVIFVGGMIALVLLNKYLNGQPLLSFPMQKSIPQRLQPLEDASEAIHSTQPLGEAFDMEVNATAGITEIYDPTTHKIPWTSFDMNNNGPDPVYFCVNEWRDPQAPLMPGKSINVDMKKQGAIKKVYLKCDQGKTANISFYIIK